MSALINYIYHFADKEHWYTEASEHREHILSSQKMSRGLAKNIILFVGDGMGMSTITASRILKGQKAGQTGEEYRLVFEKFPHVALTKVSNF